MSTKIIKLRLTITDIKDGYNAKELLNQIKSVGLVLSKKSNGYRLTASYEHEWNAITDYAEKINQLTQLRVFTHDDDIAFLNILFLDTDNSEYQVPDSASIDSIEIVIEFFYTLSFTNETYPDIEVDLPEEIRGDAGESVTLPKIYGEYEKDDKMYHPLAWDIGEFLSSYILNENTTANLLWEEISTLVGIVFDDAPITLDEGNSISRNFKLLSKPTENVIITLSTLQSDRLEIYPTTLTFTSSNWDIDQFVRFTARDNNIDDGDITSTVKISVSSLDTRYDNLPNSSLSIAINDDDTAGLDYNTSSMELMEGEFNTRTFKLMSEPRNNVTLELNISTRLNNRISISPTTLTFTPSDWNIGRNVVFTAIDNSIDDSDITDDITILATSDDSKYNNLLSSLSITVKDNDVAGLDYNASSTTLIEGNINTRTFKLRSQPTNNVVVSISSVYNDRLNISHNELTFTPSNWNITQTVKFTAINNSIDDGDINAIVIINVSSNDTRYNNLPESSFTIIIRDNDTAGLNYDTSSINLTECESITRTFKLKSEPQNNVTLELSTLQSDRLDILPTTLTFTPSDWNVGRSVRFTAFDNNIDDGNVTSNVKIKAISDDIKYSSLPDSYLSITINDNDTAGLDYDTSPINLTEGESITRTFKLMSEPNGSVTVAITSTQPTRLEISPSSITFNSSNWNNAVNVIFKAKDNEEYDGDVTATVHVTSSSAADSGYNLSGNDFTINISDNDENIFGTLAFESGYFAVDIDPDYELPILNRNGQPTQFVKTQWRIVYNTDNDYTVYQVPKSSNLNPFEYDLLYDENIHVI